MFSRYVAAIANEVNMIPIMPMIMTNTPKSKVIS